MVCGFLNSFCEDCSVLRTPQISDLLGIRFLTFDHFVVVAERLSVAVIAYGNKKVIVLFSLYYIFFYGSAFMLFSITGGMGTLGFLCAEIRKAFYKHSRILTVKHCS